jgi:hypothetical protein
LFASSQESPSEFSLSNFLMHTNSVFIHTAMVCVISIFSILHALQMAQTAATNSPQYLEKVNPQTVVYTQVC